MSQRRQVFLFVSCVLLALGAAASAYKPGPTQGGNVAKAPGAPLPAACWTITGPLSDGKETYFKASNNCETPRHCKVWVNGTEPPAMVHLEPGTSARIDIGVSEKGDKFSTDCSPVGVYGEHND